MPPLTEVVAGLVAGPRPVLCLDTCDILEVVQCLDWEKPGSPRNIRCIEPVHRLIGVLESDPSEVRLAITTLVALEWTQNLPAIRAKAERFLIDVDVIAAGPIQAATLAGLALPPYAALSGGLLVGKLELLAANLLGRAIRIDLDDSLIARAVQRVMDKTRPSHEGHLKDSINFEHYLGLARLLRAGGFAGDCLFVSKNRRDYWHGSHPAIHPTLAPEIDDPAVRLRFFGSIAAALGALGI